MSNEVVTVATPDAVALVVDAEKILDLSSKFAIDSVQMFELAADELKSIKAKMKDLDTRRKAITKPLDEAKSRIMDLFNRPLDLLEQAEQKLKNAMLGFQKDQEKKRREAEELAREVARKEQARLQAEAEKAAKKAEKKGDVEAAQQLRETVPIVPVPTVAIEKPKVKGISTSTKWKARVVNADLIPRQYLIVNEKMLNDLAQATKGSVEVAGVEFYSEEIMAASAR